MQNGILIAESQGAISLCAALGVSRQICAFALLGNKIVSPCVAKMALRASLLALILCVWGGQWDCMSSHSQLYYYSDVWSPWYPKLNTTSTLTVVGINTNPSPVSFNAFSLWFMHGVNMTLFPNFVLPETTVVEPAANFSLSYPVDFTSTMFTNETYWVFLELYLGGTEVSCWHLSELTVGAGYIALGAVICFSLTW